jgi:hypothetical protein
MRETTNVWQHAVWVHLDTGKASMQSSIPTTNLAHSVSFSWDGIAQAALPLAEHADTFTGPNGSFHRAMPAVVLGEPVPPPFIRLCVRHWNTERDTILAEETQRVFVPQVVNLIQFGGSAALAEPVYTHAAGNDPPVLLYTGCEEYEAEAMLHRLPAMATAFFPTDVNLRIVMGEDVSGRIKSMTIVSATSRGSRRGDSSGFRKRNSSPTGEMAIYVESFQRSLQKKYDYMLAGYNDIIPIPMTPEQFAQYIAPTVAHEIGHSLGLVDLDWLPATPPGEQRNHNALQTWIKMMDMGGLFYVKHRLNPHPTAYWLPDNLRYLRFVLPKGEP